MSHKEIQTITSNADMIVCGYAFTRMPDLNIQVVQLPYPNHALVLSPEDEILETSMDDVELDIVTDYWKKNKKLMEECYA